MPRPDDPAAAGGDVRTTHLHRPGLPTDAIERPRVLAALDAGADRPLALLCAPAGFGKTIAVSQWCSTSDQPVAWLSLDASMDDPQRFLRYFVSAVREVIPEALETVAQMVAGVGPLAERAVVTELANGLDELVEPVVIVLDDYHSVSSPEVHRILSALLRHPSPSVHFLISSREEPQLPIASLRGRGQLTELRMAELAFDLDETRRFLRGNLGESIGEDEIVAQLERTEGWPVGLRLGVEASRLSGDRTLLGPGMLDRAAQEYLVAEVLELLPPQIRRGVLVLSTFDRFDAGLCDLALGGLTPGVAPMSGAEFIDWLGRHNLFLVQLEGDGTWFRFHHLFAALLERLRSEQLQQIGVSQAEVRRAGAAALESRGMAEEAIGQLLLAGETAAATRLAAAHGNDLVEGERWLELTNLLDALPRDVEESDPALLVLRAWLLGDVLTRHAEMTTTLDMAEHLLDRRNDQPGADDPVLRGQIAALRGAYEKFVRADFDGAAADSEVARRLLAESAGRPLVFAFVLGTLADAGAGRAVEAHRLAASVAGDRRFAGAPFDPMSWALPYLGWIEGDLTLLERHAAQLLAIGDRFGLPDTIASAHYFLGVAAYERNQLGAADRHLTQVIERRFQTMAVNVVHAGAALALTRLAQGRPEDADAVAEMMMGHILDVRSDYLQPVGDAFMAELSLRQGRGARAARWAHLADADAPRHRFMFFDPRSALIEILLSSPSDGDAGRVLLAELLDRARGHHHVPLTMRLLGLSALAADAQGDEELALSQLSSAIAISHSGGMVRRLADLGPALAPLLQRLDVGSEVLPHVAAVLDAILVASPDDSGQGSAAAVGRQEQVGLTERELDILRLLSSRRTNKEIAGELLIAPSTVKKHTVRLYEKLNVHGRREAVTKAKALGYVSEVL